MFKLVIQDDEGKTTVVPLIRDEITIGRKEGNTIRLTERNVSRKHARIVRANGTVAIEDLGSYNGVRVNGTRIAQRTALTISDRVQIGDYLIELKAEGAEQADSYGDARTQPIERVDAAAMARSGNGLGTGAAVAVSVPGGMPGALMGAPGATQVALADTDPGQMRMAAVPAVHTTGHARLVILSSNFAGREFELAKPQMIIGRTDDNDVVVNHRSISRNHAKIVREVDTGRYTISDLQSSNGVRVNGEEYGKVELRRGDIIDLGHVRLRFIEPGEDFLFGRDAQAVDMPSGGGRSWLWALLGLLVVGGAVVVVAVSGGGSGDKEPVVAAGTDPGKAEDPSGTKPVVGDPPAATPDATGTAGEPAITKVDGADAEAAPTAANAEVAKAIEEARAALQDEKWTDALAAAKRALSADPNNGDARAFADQAKQEVANSLIYEDLKQAIKTRDHAQVRAQYDKIGPDSVYKDRALADHDKVRDAYVAEMRDKAKALVKQNKCKDARKLATQAEKVWPEAGQAVTNEAASCQEAVAATPPTRPVDNGTKPEVKPDKPDKPDADPPKDPNAILNEARSAAKSSQWGRALRLCEEVLRADKGNVEAVMVCALSACNMKNAAKAKSYIGRLSTSRASLARQSCLRNQVVVD